MLHDIKDSAVTLPYGIGMHDIYPVGIMADGRSGSNAMYTIGTDTVDPIQPRLKTSRHPG
jgi:hypothetical protein